MTRDLQVIILDDHPVVLHGLAGSLQPGSGVQVRSAHATCRSFFDALAADGAFFDAAIVDYLLAPEDLDCMGLLRKATSCFPRLPILVLSSEHNQVTVQAAFRAGARGFLSKTAQPRHIVTALQSIVAGRMVTDIEAAPAAGRHKDIPAALHDGEVAAPLTAREREVLTLILGGLSTNEIARRLQRSASTISTIKRSGLERLGIHSNGELFKLRHLLGLDQESH